MKILRLPIGTWVNCKEFVIKVGDKDANVILLIASLLSA